MIPNKIYDILKWITLIALPALGTLYFALSGIWGLPYGEQIVGTIAAIITFLGTILGISTIQYNKNIERSKPVLDEVEYFEEVEEVMEDD